jgi:hypothetical protein
MLNGSSWAGTEMSLAALLGNSMIRTAWLALLCLIGVGIMAAVKVTTASRATPSVPMLSEQKDPRIPLTQGVAAISVARPEPDKPEPSNKSDRVDVNVDIQPTVTRVTPMVVEPANPQRDTAPVLKLVSRHWRDPLAPKLVKPVSRPTGKSTDKRAARRASPRE